ncbi:MAG TPA: CPBP family intramembrane glutamic endopeptidase [Acidimicrobiales bacterium]|nr:CPBP family intramembrane glutamic endopeptidase [Acidimicrobiales bacterium]
MRPDRLMGGSPRGALAVAAGGFAVGIVFSAITAAVAEAATGYSVSAGGPVPVAVTVADLLGLWVGLLGAVVYASRAWGSGRLARDFGLRVAAWWEVPLGVAVGAASQYLLVPAVYLPLEQVDRGLSRQLGQPALRETGAAHGVPAAAVVFVFLALGAPLVEELFFRGLILGSLMRLVPAPVAVVGTGLLFALAHFEAAQFLGLAAFGVVLGILAWRTGRLASSVAAHMAFNAVAVVTVVHLR